MKKTFHNLSVFLCILLAVLGACLIASRGRLEEEAGTMYLFAGALQIVMSLIALFMGVVLPEEGRKMSGRAKKIMRVIVALAMLGGNGTSGINAYNALSGDVILQRFWEPAWYVAWLGIEGAFLLAYPEGGITGTLALLSAAALVCLIATSLGWSIIYRKENGTFKWYLVLGPSLVILIIFGIIATITFIEDARRGPVLSEKIDDAGTEIEKALKDYEDGSYSEEAVDASRMTMDDIIGMLKNDVGGDVYYCWVPDDDVISLIAWSDESGDVYVYQFTKRGDTYALNTGFISTSLTKEDVEGKEQGVIPGQSHPGE